MPRLDSFIDAHCHMFTIADVPLYETIRHAADGLHPMTGGVLGIAAGVAGPKLVRRFEPMITFMEAEPAENPLRVEREIEAALRKFRINADRIITTPLVMDFDLNGKVDKLRGQVERLVEAAGGCERMLALPFLGLDPRRFVYGSGGGVRSKARMLASLDEYLSAFEVKPIAQRNKLESGNIVGIKMYPPLGFSPLPTETKARNRHLDFYEDLCDRQLPITVHCQKTSFSLVSGKKADSYTQPKNWLAILTALKKDRGKDLRLNLGHFGGDSGLERLIGGRDDRDDDPFPERGHLRTKTWTFQIAKILRKFPHVYADISAIDFHDKHTASAFLWLLQFDREKPLAEGDHPLVTKLLWGSDYPMVLSQAPTYTDVLSSFLETYRKLPEVGSRRHPKASDLPPRAQIIKKLCCDNPTAFLFGGPES